MQQQSSCLRSTQHNRSAPAFWGLTMSMLSKHLIQSIHPVPGLVVFCDLHADLLGSAWTLPTTTPSRECRGSPGTHQLLGPHVVEDPLCILAVVPALHDCQEQLWSVVLKGRKNTTSHCMESQAERTQLQLLHTHCPEELKIPGF